MGKKGRKQGKATKAPVKRNRTWLYTGIGVGLVGLIILIISFTAGGGSTTPGDSASQPNTPLAQNASLPAWLARAPATTKEAYAYAAAHPETLSYVPCYCGCGQHSGHRSANDCFIGNRNGNEITYDDHGANCAMCVDIAVMTKKNLAQGKTLAQARQAVVQKYSSIGPATNTPPIPQG